MMMKKGSKVQWFTSQKVYTGEVLETNQKLIEFTRNGVQVTRMGKPNNHVLMIKQDNADVVLKLENEVQLLQPHTVWDLNESSWVFLEGIFLGENSGYSVFGRS